MKKFHVLDRALNLHQHYLLEASAGTGKTFSIQNIVVRLLIQSHADQRPFSLDKILVVTFTRAAVRDLKLRIRANIEQALFYLHAWLNQEGVAQQAPDYLKALMEQGEEAVQQARKYLQQALFGFDRAQIFTIHSFCARMLRQFALESDSGLHALGGDEPLAQSEVRAIVGDFFRTGVRLEHYSPSQLDILLREDPEQRKLLRAIQSPCTFPSLPTFKESYAHFIQIMQNLKGNLNLNCENLVADFQCQMVAYRNHKAGESKAETLAKVTRFAKLFDKSEWSIQDFETLIQDGIVWVKALDSELLKSTPPAAKELNYPHFTEQLKSELASLVIQTGDFSILLARMANDCQKLLKRYQHEEEKFSPDDILSKMNLSLNEPSFISQVQANYQATIIDEFQDTDPLQWNIFHRLFLAKSPVWGGFLYLVGDPKQSIYSFRQADVYTYLSAAQVLGEERCFSLDVNYRSQPRLVHALNTLFSSHHLPQLIPLPKRSRDVAYQPVQASQPIDHASFDDEKGAIHFFLADGQAFKRAKMQDLETHVFFPFISQQIQRLQRQKNFHFRQFAVLVRDRHQALRLTEFFDQVQIPYLNQRGTSLVDSVALQSLIDIIRAVLHPQDHRTIRAALGSPVIGWSQEEIKHLSEMERILLTIQHLRICLFEKGFASFFQELLKTSFQSQRQSVLEQMLCHEGGIELYRDLQQIADLIVDYQYQEWNSPEGIVAFLDQFSIWDQNEDERVKRFQDPSIDGVKILTLHFSKGLEFDVVFALGLANRTGIREDLIPIECEGQHVLTPVDEHSEAYQSFYEENDAEKMRQLYVAFTRARLQLYIPAALHIPSEQLTVGEASPMDLFLAKLNQPTASHPELYERIKTYTGQPLIEFLETVGLHTGMTYSLHQEVILDSSKTSNPLLVEALFPPPTVRVSSQPIWMTSFSTLSQQAERTATERLSLSSPPPKDYHCPMQEIHTLPANPEIGLLIHSILEKVSFKDFQPLTHCSQALSLISPFLQKTTFKAWDRVIADLMFNTLKTPLNVITPSFCLADLESTHLYREMPFIFPYHTGQGIQDIQFQKGLIKGVIDLFFVHQGLYYLVDWKTNWLGSNAELYIIPLLERAMEENAYFLQATIYTEAMKRYLKLVDTRPFEECFGGVLYLFIRGLVPGQDTGIYHFFP